MSKAVTVRWVENQIDRTIKERERSVDLVEDGDDKYIKGMPIFLFNEFHGIIYNGRVMFHDGSGFFGVPLARIISIKESSDQDLDPR